MIKYFVQHWKVILPVVSIIFTGGMIWAGYQYTAKLHNQNYEDIQQNKIIQEGKHAMIDTKFSDQEKLNNIFLTKLNEITCKVDRLDDKFDKKFDRLESFLLSHQTARIDATDSK